MSLDPSHVPDESIKPPNSSMATTKSTVGVQSNPPNAMPSLSFFSISGSIAAVPKALGSADQSSPSKIYNTGVIAVPTTSACIDDSPLQHKSESPQINYKVPVQDVLPTAKSALTATPEQPCFASAPSNTCRRFSETQIEIMKAKFETDKYLTAYEAEQLASETGLTKLQVSDWFSSRRYTTGTTHTLTQYTPEQLAVLRENFLLNPIPTSEKLRMLASKTGLSTKHVTIWFARERNRIKKKGMGMLILPRQLQ